MTKLTQDERNGLWTAVLLTVALLLATALTAGMLWGRADQAPVPVPPVQDPVSSGALRPDPAVLDAIRAAEACAASLPSGPCS